MEPVPLDRSVPLAGLDLRHAAITVLQRWGPASIAEILTSLTSAGFTVAGEQPNKTVADALRWETRSHRRRVMRTS